MFFKLEKRNNLGFGIVLSIKNKDIGATYLSLGLGKYNFIIGCVI